MEEQLPDIFQYFGCPGRLCNCWRLILVVWESSCEVGECLLSLWGFLIRYILILSYIFIISHFNQIIHRIKGFAMLVKSLKQLSFFSQSPVPTLSKVIIEAETKAGTSLFALLIPRPESAMVQRQPFMLGRLSVFKCPYTWDPNLCPPVI